MEQEAIIIVSCFGAAWLLLLILVIGLFARVNSLKKLVKEMQVTGRLRVQKLKMNPDKNHAFHNPGLVPDEELSRRGFTMYSPDDVETASRIHERYVMQTGGQFVEELSREIDQRQQRLRNQDSFTRSQDSNVWSQVSNATSQDSNVRRQDSFIRDTSLPRSRDSPVRTHDSAPPFLLHSIEENKRITRSLMNPNANPNNSRPSETNPNFIY